MPAGRPSSFEDKFIDQARVACGNLGATDADLAELFGVSVTTIDNWKNEFPEFLGALKAGKVEYDSQVVRKLRERAMGYSHPAVKIFHDKEAGTTLVDYTEHYPPDTTACIFWLKNRQPSEWREKQEVEHSGKVTLEALVEASWNREKPPGDDTPPAAVM